MASEEFIHFEAPIAGSFQWMANEESSAEISMFGKQCLLKPSIEIV